MQPSFSERLIHWQRQFGRHHLPWQVSDPYCVWLSEIMLQQTQVATVLDYYPRFLRAFPNVAALAAAKQDEVLALWAGLGYYSRARFLHAAAMQVMDEFGGAFPDSRENLMRLKGVGRSTAAAIAAFAFGRREAILDGNVKRVLCRVFALDGEPGNRAFEAKLWDLAEHLLPEKSDEMAVYTQGLMDLGATVCTRAKPDCASCPMVDVCQAKALGLVGALPRRKTPAAVRTVSMFWLVLRRGDGAVWLEKRAQQGIWAGLYAVPCFETLGQLHDFTEQCGLLFEDAVEQAAMSHRLTHRLLEILPFELRLGDEEIFRQPEKGAWVLPHEWRALGLPKPLDHYLNGEMVFQAA